jgi:malonate transporter and related proteins
MPAILESLIPVFLVISLGWATKASGFITKEQWDGFERVTYYVLIPALIITTLAMADMKKVPVGTVGITLLVPVALISALMWIIRKPLQQLNGIEGPAFTSIFQGAVRWNSFVAIALASSLFGVDGLAVAAVAVAFLIPFVNVCSAYTLAMYGSLKKPLTPFDLLANLIKNPFIWSTAVGLIIGMTGIPIPKPIAVFGDITGRAALAAGLLLVGSGLEVSNLKKPSIALWLSVGLKLVLLPVLTGLLGQALGLSGVALAIPVLCAAVPTAAASYILARQNGGDASLMASIITAQTLVAAITMPMMFSLFLK